MKERMEGGWLYVRACVRACMACLRQASSAVKRERIGYSQKRRERDCL
jgi:hypothetical protein